MQQSGIVSQLNGSIATVTGERASTCGSCAGKSSCSTLGGWNSRPLEMKANNDLGAKVGDVVVIEVPDHLVLKSAFTLYGVPMLFFFGAGTFAYLVSQALNLGSPDLWAALSGLAAVAGYYLSGILKESDRAGLEARIVRIQTQHGSVSHRGMNCRIDP